MICWSECVVIICLLWLLPAEIKFYYGLLVRDFISLDGGILVLLLAVLSEIALGKEFHSALVWCVFIVMELIFLLIKRCVVFRVEEFPVIRNRRFSVNLIRRLILCCMSNAFRSEYSNEIMCNFYV